MHFGFLIIGIITCYIWIYKCTGAVPTVTLTASSSRYFDIGGSISLTCSINEDVGIKNVYLTKDGRSYVLIIINNASSCVYYKLQPSVDPHSYSITCEQQMTVRIVMNGTVASDNNTVWGCQMSAELGICTNACMSISTVRIALRVPVSSVQLTDGTGQLLVTPVTVLDGSSKVFRCDTSPNGSRPRALFTWYKRSENQSPILIQAQSVSTPSPNPEDDLSLSISYSTLTLIGSRSYQNMYICCEARDETNRGNFSRSTEAQLNIVYGPDNVQVTPSGTLNVNEGGHMNLTCTAECNPPCTTYHWIKDSLLTIVGSSQSYWISEVRRNHFGIYSCTVTNTIILKNATAQIKVIVNYGPDASSTTVSPNQTLERVEFSPLSVTCSADCYPICQFIWTGPGIYSYENTGVLSISQINRDQTGVFTCTATNPEIINKSATANLFVIVLYGPDEGSVSLSPNQTFECVEFSPLSVNCSANCFPSCQFEWTGPGNYSYGNTRVLSIPQIKRDQAGVFTCTAMNPRIPNRYTTANLSVTVFYSPTVDVESRNGSHNDTNLLIKCSAHGIPEQYTYRLTHKSLSSGIEIRQVSYEFISTGVMIHRFNNPTYMDTGIYTCSVNNGILDYTDGVLDKRVSSFVWIKGLPYITSRETSFYAEIGHSGRLIIELYNSLLDLVVTWYKHNGGALEKLLNSDKYNIIIASSMVDVNFYSVRIHEPGFIATLEIRNITEEDFTLYQVHVQNSVGEMYPLQLQLRVIGSTPQEKIDSGPVIIGSAIGSTFFVSLIVTVIGILLFRKRNAHDKGNRVKQENTPRSLETSTEKGEGPQSTDNEGQYLELQQINGEDSENLNVRSSRTVFYETIHSNPSDQEHDYHALCSGERITYENTNVLQKHH